MAVGQMLKTVALIPTRLNSRRLPKKSLELIGNLPLIIHTYRRVLMSKKINDVYICCDSKEVFEIAKKFKAKAILTSKNHECGTDRIYEAFKKLKRFNFNQVINVQGDEPLIDPKNIDKVIEYHKKFKNYDIILPNLPVKFQSNVNLVKVIFNKAKQVIFLTRSDAPNHFRKKPKIMYKHLSIISFKPWALKEYAKFKRTKLEMIEDVELLRAIDIGLKIKTFTVKGNSFSIDVKKDLIEVKKKILQDKNYKIYKNGY